MQISQVFTVRDSTISTGDNCKSGLTPTWRMLKKLSDLTDLPNPDATAVVTPVGNGQYRVTYDAEANGEATGQLDVGAGLTNGNDRYIDVVFSRDSTRIQSAINAQGKAAVDFSQVVDGAITLGQVLELELAISAGRFTVSWNANTLTQTTTYYRADNTTVIATMTTVFDANGRPTNRTVAFGTL